ncbi:nicotinate-nucleotide adenylyltransferase [Evansella sp. AB-P1]|uniref:nicotinate-nucleotide adenylyltransferase n=1 Tax=Evansella sp. AB-P1 TaxID=3037653 RepID=UPI00241E0B90|nr:nicotinate-nucleotide adenylyltransferase [Evansella sp. AB-P1]MDG5786514.1 nicotinate-nucleotide adenylyltransferase [Evansella sp. AB-P1]
MKRIGILGGTFDPPHIGHLLMAEESRIKMNLDEIWWMPNRIPPHKETATDSLLRERLMMVQHMTDLHEKYILCDVELKRNGPSYTVDTMELLNEKYAHYEFFFIIGEDSLQTLDKWHRSDYLKSLVSFIVIRRPGYEHEMEKANNGILFIEGPTIDVSSTDIRKTLKEKKEVNRFLLTKEVYELIKEHQLYE